MRLALVANDADCVRVQITGGITSKELKQDEDPMEDLMGSEIYTRNVLLSLRDNDYIDSSGISWLLARHRQFGDNGGRLVLHSLAPFVLNVIRIMKMNLVFEIADDEADAERKLNEQGE